MKRIMLWANYPIGVSKAFNKLDIDIYSASEYVRIKDEGKKIEWLNRNVDNKTIDYFFSFNFIICLSKWCYEHNVIYICWSVDSPHLSIYSDITNYETNRIIIFDNYEYCYLKSIGTKNVFYYPLATDVESLHERALGLNNTPDRFVQDVSFMGNMYDKAPHNMYDQVKFLPEYLHGYIDALIEAQSNLWGVDLLKTDAFRTIVEEVRKYIKVEFENNYLDEVYYMFLDRMICMKIAQLERKKMCEILSTKYNFTLYSGSDTSWDKKIHNGGYIDYINDMPYMFHNTKININLSLHCISTGIPLRVLDILACEGFCLTNYQTEIEEYFESGKELVMFSDFDDMCNKIEYYLSHEDERIEIAHNGYQRVRDDFDYCICIPRIMEMIKVQRNSD